MSTTSSSLPAVPAAANDDKTIAIVSYLTLIGFIAAVVMHGSKKTSLGSYHLRQSLGLMATSVAVFFAGMLLAFIPVLGWLIDLGLWFGLVVLWFSGFLAAVGGDRKPVAVLGQHFQTWFAGAFE